MPKRKITKALLVCAAFILALMQLDGVARAQQPELPDLTIDAAMRTQVIDGVLKTAHRSIRVSRYCQEDGAVNSRAREQQGVRSNHQREGIRGEAHERSARGQSR